ncbi:MAG: hypothetical protein H7210_11540 [Pyrinomonadaceae bacterium]|nr:hypothetical protein [Phycisphaerales bacterium]
MISKSTSRKTSTLVSGMPLTAILVAGVLLMGTPTLAQVTSAPVAPKKSVRRSVLDLLTDAKKPRQGEILPDSTGATNPPLEQSPDDPAQSPASNESVPTPDAGRKPVGPMKPVTPAAAAPEKTNTASNDQTRSPAAPRDAQRVVRATPAIASTPALSASGTRFVAFDKARLYVVSQQGNTSLIQWRLADDGSGKPGAWAAIPADAQVTDRREFRTGVGVSVDVRIDDQAVVRVGPLTRALFERRIRSDGTSLPGVTLARGEITVTESSTTDVVVKTGADSSLVRSGRISFDGTEPATK